MKAMVPLTIPLTSCDAGACVIAIKCPNKKSCVTPDFNCPDLRNAEWPFTVALACDASVNANGVTDKKSHVISHSVLT